MSSTERLDQRATIAVPLIAGGPILMRLCLPVMMIVLIAVTKLWKANDDKADRAMGVGAFNLVRRSALEQAGGMKQLRMEIADDVGLGTIIRESGGRSRLALATDRLSVVWYRSTRDFLQGMEKGAQGRRSNGTGRRSLILSLLTSILLAPFALASTWIQLPIAAAIAALAACVLAIATAMFSALRFGLPWIWVFVLPVGLLLTLLIALRSFTLAFIRGGVRWRGDSHSLDSAQDGERGLVPTIRILNTQPVAIVTAAARESAQPPEDYRGMVFDSPS